MLGKSVVRVEVWGPFRWTEALEDPSCKSFSGCSDLAMDAGDIAASLLAMVLGESERKAAIRSAAVDGRDHAGVVSVENLVHA